MDRAFATAAAASLLACGAVTVAGACGSTDRQAPPPRYVEVRQVPPAGGSSTEEEDAGSVGPDRTFDGGAPEGPSHLGVVIRSARGRFGTQGTQGLVVLRVVPDSPAAHAGLRPGDVILSADGKPLEHTMTLVRYVRGVPPGVAVRLEVVRDGNRQTYDIVAAPRPEDEQNERDPR